MGMLGLVLVLVFLLIASYAIAFETFFMSNEDWGLTELIIYSCLVVFGIGCVTFAITRYMLLGVLL